MAAGRPTEALQQFDLALKWAPQRVLSLQGRTRALAAGGDPKAAN